MTHNGLKHIFKHVFEKCNKDGFLTPPKSVTNVTLFFEGFPYKKEIGKMSKMKAPAKGSLQKKV